MKIGYACISVTSNITTNRRCVLKNASEDNLRKLIKENLCSLKELLKYNVEKEIYFFRISSDIIPFGSHPVNKLKWWEENRQLLLSIGSYIKDNNIRVSMHPGQYTVLNSLKEEIVLKAVKDLEYHCRFLDSMELNGEHKIVLHIGGAYGDKKESMKRFIYNYNSLLSDNIKKRLVIENDERNFNIEELIYISRKTGAPVVFDNLHNEVNPCSFGTDICKILKEVNTTWKVKDGTMKVHYSNAEKYLHKNIGAHSSTIDIVEFSKYINEVEKSGMNIDIMLEVKDKDISAIRCINIIKHQLNK